MLVSLGQRQKVAGITIAVVCYRVSVVHRWDGLGGEGAEWTGVDACGVAVERRAGGRERYG